MAFVFLLSWIPSFGLARYLSKPIEALEKRVKKLTNRDWEEPIQLDREDEIGRLGESVELLRNQLLQQDEAQKSFLQNISHELKTPVMIIRSYTQAIQDGVYPKGDLEPTVKVIEDEAKRLEKRIRNLLYLTKLDYLATQKPSHEVFDLDILIKDVVRRFDWHRSEVKLTLELKPIKIIGDYDQWTVLLENLLDNQVRYATNKITLSVEEINGFAQLHIWNNGQAFDDVGLIFDTFAKGQKVILV